MEELKKQAIEIFKNNLDGVDASLLQRKLKIGVIKTNKLIEALEDENLISEPDKNRKRKLL